MKGCAVICILLPLYPAWVACGLAHSLRAPPSRPALGWHGSSGFALARFGSLTLHEGLSIFARSAGSGAAPGLFWAFPLWLLELLELSLFTKGGAESSLGLFSRLLFGLQWSLGHPPETLSELSFLTKALSLPSIGLPSGALPVLLGTLTFRLLPCPCLGPAVLLCQCLLAGLRRPQLDSCLDLFGLSVHPARCLGGLTSALAYASSRCADLLLRLSWDFPKTFPQQSQE